MSGADDLLPGAEDRRLGGRLLPATGLDQPFRARRRTAAGRAGRGRGRSSRAAAAPCRRRRRPPGAPLRGRACAGASAASSAARASSGPASPRPRPRRRPARRPPASWSLGFGLVARRRPSGAGRSVGTADRPFGDLVAGAAQARPARRRRTAQVTSSWLAPPTSSASRSRRPASSSANTSSSDEHRLDAVGAQQVVRGQPQRQRERPGLAVAGVALGRQLAQGQGQVVAVRADQGDAALDSRTAGRRPARPAAPVSSVGPVGHRSAISTLDR